MLAAVLVDVIGYSEGLALVRRVCCGVWEHLNRHVVPQHLDVALQVVAQRNELVLAAPGARLLNALSVLLEGIGLEGQEALKVLLVV